MDTHDDRHKPNRLTKLQAQAVLFDLMAEREPDRTRRFTLRWGAVLLRAHDRQLRGEQ